MMIRIGTIEMVVQLNAALPAPVDLPMWPANLMRVKRPGPVVVISTDAHHLRRVRGRGDDGLLGGFGIPGNCHLCRYCLPFLALGGRRQHIG